MISQSLTERFNSAGYAACDAALSEAEMRHADDAVGAWAERQIHAWTGSGLRTTDYRKEFLDAWRVAGQPHFRRSPYVNLLQPSFFAFLRSPRLLELVGELLATDELSLHGIFNCRPMMPNAPVTPWHQDAQYWRKHGEPDLEAARTRRVVTIWIALQDLDEEIGGLEVAPLSQTKAQLFSDDLVEPGTDFLTVSKDVKRTLKGETPLVHRGGCILFSQLTMHRGTPNPSRRIRWSIDARYEATDGALTSGKKFGFVAHSPSGRYAEDTFETWRERCAANLSAKP